MTYKLANRVHKVQPSFTLEMATRAAEMRAEGIDVINFSVHTNTIAKLAELYKDTLGSLNPTIMVRGEQIYLTNQKTANHIRALLLAGVRAVSLWKSQGGKTWHLLLNKKKTLQYINTLSA